jgi:hypothetical protein
VNAQACQVTLKRLDLAFRHFFRRVKNGGTPGFPGSRRSNAIPAGDTRPTEMDGNSSPAKKNDTGGSDCPAPALSASAARPGRRGCQRRSRSGFSTGNGMHR